MGELEYLLALSERHNCTNGKNLSDGQRFDHKSYSCG